MTVKLEHLLQLTPEAHIVAMFNRATMCSITADDVHISPPVALEGTRTKVTLTPKNNRVIGETDFYYNRVRVPFIFGEILRFSYELPVTIYGLLGVYSQKTGIIFTSSDFENKVVRAYSEKLTASSQSLRWVGESVIKEPLDVRLPLSELINQPYLEGFVR